MLRKRKGDPPQALQEVNHGNQPHRPAADHPFRRAFSQRRMGAPDCNTRHAPFTPTVSNAQSSNTKLPWHERNLPDHWDADEVRFFRNWMKELAALNDTLTSIAADRAKLLRKARRIYFKLAYKLSEQVRELATQTRGDAAKAIRR